jgi:hypothetical protein
MDMSRPHILAALGVTVLTLACQDDQPRRVAAPPDAQRSDSVLSLTVSSLKPAVGSTITVTANVARRASFKPVGSFKAHLRYDPSGLTFLQQSRLPTGIRALNPQPGDIIAAGAAADGFEDGRLFAVTFQVQKPVALASLEFEIEEMNGTNFADQLPAVHEKSVRVAGTRR